MKNRIKQLLQNCVDWKGDDNEYENELLEETAKLILEELYDTVEERLELRTESRDRYFKKDVELFNYWVGRVDGINEVLQDFLSEKVDELPQPTGKDTE